jgi:hypothetical protein
VAATALNARLEGDGGGDGAADGPGAIPP